jgi:hypothetical protein
MYPLPRVCAIISVNRQVRMGVHLAAVFDGRLGNAIQSVRCGTLSKQETNAVRVHHT